MKTIAISLLCLSLATGAARAQEAASVAGPAPTLAPGDAVKLQIWQEPDLSGTFRVDENSTLTLPLLGARNVGSVSVEDLRQQLVKDYAVHLKNPSIEVTVYRRVTVLGEVQSPGLYDVDPSMRMGDALALAGGITPEGDDDSVEIVRDGQTIAKELAFTMPIGDRVRSGDQILVDQKGWWSRNGDKVLIGFGGTVVAVLLRSTIWN